MSNIDRLKYQRCIIKMEDLKKLTLTRHRDDNSDRGKQRITFLIISCKSLAERGIEEITKLPNLL